MRCLEIKLLMSNFSAYASYMCPIARSSASSAVIAPLAFCLTLSHLRRLPLASASISSREVTTV